MDLLGPGPLAGLAYVNPNMEMYQLKLQQERADAAARQEAYAVTKDLAEMFEVGKVENPYDQGKQTEFAQTRLKEIGRYIQKNPDFMYNPEKYMQVKNLSRELRDNRWTRRSDSYKENLKLFNDAAMKDPNFMAKKHNIDMAAKIKNYNNFGSVDGDDKETEFMYTPAPAWIEDIEGDMIKQGNSIKNLDVIQGTGPGYGSYSEVPKESELNTLSIAYYERNKEQLDYAHKGKAPQEIVEYVKSRIREGVDTKYNPGMLDYDLRVASLDLERQKLAMDKAAASGDLANFDFLANEHINNNAPASQMTEKFATDWLGTSGDIAFYGNTKDNPLKVLNMHNVTRGNQVIKGLRNLQGKPVMGFSTTGYLGIQEAIAAGAMIDENTVNPRWAATGETLAGAAIVDDPAREGQKRLKITGYQLFDPANDKQLYTSYNQRRYMEGNKGGLTAGSFDRTGQNQNPNGPVAGNTKRLQLGGVVAVTSDGKTFYDETTGQPLNNKRPDGTKVFYNFKTNKLYNSVTGEEYN